MQHISTIEGQMTAKGLSFEVARTVTVREQEEPAA